MQPLEHLKLLLRVLATFLQDATPNRFIGTVPSLQWTSDPTMVVDTTPELHVAAACTATTAAPCFRALFSTSTTLVDLFLRLMWSSGIISDIHDNKQRCNGNSWFVDNSPAQNVTFHLGQWVITFTLALTRNCCCKLLRSWKNNKNQKRKNGHKHKQQGLQLSSICTSCSARLHCSLCAGADSCSSWALLFKTGHE